MPGIGDGVMVDALDADAVAAIVDGRRPRHRLAARHRRAAPAGRGAPRAASPAPARSGRSTGRSRCSRWACRWARRSREAIESRIDALKQALAPWSRGKPYLNFAEKRVAIGDAIGAEAFARLEGIKASVDPDGRFRSGHAFAPATVSVGEEAVAA